MSKRLLSLLTCFWLGAICAITMEAKVKFNASLVDLRIGLDVGRTVFSAFDTFQWLIMTAVLLVVFSSKAKPLILLGLSLLAVFLYQSLLLLPQLTAQATLYINEARFLPSNSHFVYLAAEITKVCLLVLITFFSLRK